MDSFRQELLSPRMLVNSRFKPGTSLGLRNLDWGSGSLAIRDVEQRVSNLIWEKSGNPNSCGTYTGSVVRDVMALGERKILSCLGMDPRKYFLKVGGQGATSWLARVAKHLLEGGVRNIIVPQRESHNALLAPWIGTQATIHQYDETRLKNCDRKAWFRKVLHGLDPRTTIVMITLSSHITGTSFEGEDFLEFANGVPVLVDATCHLSHHQVLPNWLDFDYLVFSGHKFPGGPGASGGLVMNRRLETTALEIPDFEGSPDVYGFYKLLECTRLRTELMKSTDYGKVSGLIGEMTSFLSTLRTPEYRIELHRWDAGPVTEPIFTFSVVHHEFGHVHPELVSQILLEAYGLQIRIGGLCADFSIEYPGTQHLRDRQPELLNFGVCRISVPTYLLSEELLVVIKERLTDFLDHLSMFIHCYHVTSDGRSWRLHEDIELRGEFGGLGDEAGHREGRGCSSCRYKTTFTNLGSRKNEGDQQFGAALLDSMISQLLPRVVMKGHLVSDPVFEHPDRWFLHPRDLGHSLSETDYGL